VNEFLRQAFGESQFNERDIAAELDVDPKTVSRWLDGRLPYPRHRECLSALLGVAENDLWPELVMTRHVPVPPVPPVLTTYPHRWAVPRDVWLRLFSSAEREINILVYSGLFLAEDVGILRVLAARAASGVLIRVLLGDPDSPEVADRGEAEGVGDAVAAKIRNALACYRELREVEGVEIRLHRTTLYTSVYRADDEVLVNPHVFGVAAARAPVLHLRLAVEGDMASTYLESFERIWEDALPV
jgi:hypothetical protein